MKLAIRGQVGLVAATAFVVALGARSGGARAQGDTDAATIKKIETMNRTAMEMYDLLDTEGAKKTLNDAIALAKKKKLERNKVVARSHFNLAVVYFSGFSDAESATVELQQAAQIDSSLDLDPSYRTPELQKLWDQAKLDAKAAAKGADGGGEEPGTKPPEGDGGKPPKGGGEPKGGAEEPPAPKVDCKAVVGIEHQLVDTADGGVARTITANLGADVGSAATKVSLFYRPQGAGEFVEVPMEQQGDCTYNGEIPGKAMRGEFLHYYIAAVNKGGKVVSSKGSIGSPNIIEIAGGEDAGDGGGAEGGGAGEGVDRENPLGNGGQHSGPVVGGVTRGGETEKPASFYLSIAAGSGGGFVTGQTEQAGNNVGCCFAPALLHVFPEVGYYLSARSSIGAALRLGFTVGANIEGHATAAPAGLLRYRYSLSPTGQGLQVSAALGAGVIRHTVKLENAPAGEDTDIATTGPLLVGGGAGYVKALGGPLAVAAEVNAIMGVPVIKELGTCPGNSCVHLNFAVQFDFNVALMFMF